MEPKVGTLDRDYGDADMFRDETAGFICIGGGRRFYLSRLLELDPKNGFQRER